MNRTPTNAVRFGVFLEGRNLDRWESRSVELLRQAGATCLFILGSAVAPRHQSWKARIIDDLVLRLAGLPRRDAAGSRHPDPAEYQPSIGCLVRTAENGAGTLVPGEATQIARKGLKFILYFGDAPIPEGLSGCAEFGAWQFCRSRGAAANYPFLHGLHRGDDVVSFSLEQIPPSGGRPRPLRQGWFRARGERNHSISAQVLEQASRWPLLVLTHFLHNGVLPSCPERRSERIPRRLAMVWSLSFRELRQRLVSRLASYFVLESWNVGIVPMDFRTLLSGAALPAATMLPPLGLGRYLADPFILRRSPHLTLLAEEYDDFGVGRIVEVTIRDQAKAPKITLKVCLQSKHHLSYPFLFRDRGATYCLPECHQSNASLLYRYDEGKLVPVADLVPGARVTDGTILFHDGLYWLFCGLEDDNDHVNLHIFFSKRLSSRWSPHPLNPVKTDVRSARSAGPIVVHGGELFRPAQDCSRSYGYGVSINRIDHLSVTRYEESVVAAISPRFVSRRCKGVHTLSFADGIMVIDARLDVVGIKPLLVRLLRRMNWLARGPVRAVPFRSRSA